MTKWEYKIIDSKDISGGGIFKGKDRADVEAYLNGIGKDGWEIISLDFNELGNRFDFSGAAKREISA
jgi:hypothetical protein